MADLNFGRNRNDVEIEKLRIEEEKQKREEIQDEKNSKTVGKILLIVFLIVFVGMPSAIFLMANPDWWSEKRARFMFEECQRHCQKYEFEEAHSSLDKLYAYYKSHSNIYDVYISAEDYVFVAESQFLVSHFDGNDVEQSINKICYLLTSLPVNGVCDPIGIEEEYISSDCADYIDWVSKYNQKCDNLFSLAIGINNAELAKRILMLYKDDYATVETKNGVKIVATKATMQAAQKRYKETFK